MRNHSNFAVETAPSSSIAAGDTSISVSSNTDYPSVPFVIVVFEGGDTPEAASTKEMMFVTATSGTGPYTWTVTRDIDAYNGGGQGFTTSANVWHVADALDFSLRQGAWPMIVESTPVFFHDVPAQSGSAPSSGWMCHQAFTLHERVRIEQLGIRITATGENVDLRFGISKQRKSPETGEVQYDHTWSDNLGDLFGTTGRLMRDLVANGEDFVLEPGAYYHVTHWTTNANGTSSFPSTVNGGQHQRVIPLREERTDQGVWDNTAFLRPGSTGWQAAGVSFAPYADTKGSSLITVLTYEPGQ